MKRTLLMLAAALCVSAIGLNAQDKPADGQRRPGNPIIAALDANGDGTIDASEISNAPAALRKLDKNGDGKLTREELRPGNREGQGGNGERRRNRKNDSDKK
jgi:hypothetical protein